MERFEVGSTYDYVCDMYRVVKRTRCFVTFEVTEQAPFGCVAVETRRLKVDELNGCEVVFPLGPIIGWALKATDTFPAISPR